jgi:hypothetical protein
MSAVLHRRATSGPLPAGDLSLLAGTKAQQPTVLTGQKNSGMQPIGMFMSPGVSQLASGRSANGVVGAAALRTRCTLQHLYLIKHFCC